MSSVKSCSALSRPLLLLAVLAGVVVLGVSSEPRYVKRHVHPRSITGTKLVTQIVGYTPIPVTCSMHPCNIPDYTRVSWIVKRVVGTSVAIVGNDSCMGYCQPYCGNLQPGCNGCAFC